jgi:hypothetical protein
VAHREFRVVKGDTGDTGPQGPIGLTGPQGIQGIQGPAGVALKYVTTGPSTNAVTWTITHNLGTTSVLVQVFETTGEVDEIVTDVVIVDANTVRLDTSSTMPSNTFKVLVLG